MWLTNSSIGRKVIMSLSGTALILFLTFHACMNVVALISGEGYNAICRFLGSHWYAVGATVLLMALILVHIVYAFILTLQNRKARGNSRYAVTAKPEKVEWSSQNMLVLGLVVLLGLLLHLFNFWYNMMFAELVGEVHKGIKPTNGFEWIKYTFDLSTRHGIVYFVLYVIWLGALWFHLTHGFWSAMQTMGWSGHIWFNRWKKIGNVFMTLVILMFLALPVGFATKMAPSLNCCKKTEKCEMLKDCNTGDKCKADPTCHQGQKGHCNKQMGACPMKNGTTAPDCCKEDCQCGKPDCGKDGADCCKTGKGCDKEGCNPQEKPSEADQ